MDVPTKNLLYSPSKTKESFFRDQFDKHKNTYIKVTIQIQKKHKKHKEHKKKLCFLCFLCFPIHHPKN